MPSVFVLDSITSLPKLIKKALQIKVNANEVGKYIHLLEKNSFDFDLFKFVTAYQDYFYYGGHLIDVEIPLEKMKKFIEMEKIVFDKLAIQYIKKLEKI